MAKKKLKRIQTSYSDKNYQAARTMYSRYKKAGKALPKLEGKNEYIDWWHVVKVKQASRAKQKVAINRAKYGQAFSPKVEVGKHKGKVAPHYIDAKTGKSDWEHLKTLGDYGEYKTLKSIKKNFGAERYWTMERAYVVDKKKWDRLGAKWNDSRRLNRAEWDLMVEHNKNGNKTWLKYEVKTQLTGHKLPIKSLKTGRTIYGSVNVEVSNYTGKGTGWNKSKAHIWAFVDDKKGVGYISADRIEELIPQLRQGASTQAINESYTLRLPHDELKWYKD